MYETFVNYLSPELMSQAEYINGVLYLPVYGLFSEILTLLGALLTVALILLITGIFAEIAWCVGCLVCRRFRKSQG